MSNETANHSQYFIPLNLQYFAEEFAGEPTPTGEPEGQGNEPAPEPTSTEPVEPMFKLKYNHEEKEIPYSQAVELAQKGMNYDKVQERLQSLETNPGLAWIQQQAERYGMTPEQLVTAFREQEEQEQLDQLVQSNIPPEYAQEMLENRKFREQYQAQQEQTKKEQAQQKMYQEFLEAYPDIKGEDIPAEVWQEVNQGKNLLDAYIRHENQLLRQQLDGIKAKEQAAQANQANAQTSTGSVKGQGQPANGFISKDVFEANRSNREWVMKNYDLLTKSMNKW